MNDSLSGRVALVTGAGGGLGREHALALARAGASVVINDLGGARNGDGGRPEAAEAVAAQIRDMGGVAWASGADITDPDDVAAMIADAEAALGPIDILVNNAGILRDKTFAKMDLADFRKVIDVHLMGAVHCTKALWNGMRDRGFGRIVFTTSSSGLYGNFGQSNYGAAKLALVGLMNTLRIEGTRHGIRVNCISPSAATRMTGDVLDDVQLDALRPELVAPGVVALCLDDAPNGIILCSGAGHYGQAHITLTKGKTLHAAQPGDVIAHLAAIADRADEMVPDGGPLQARWEIAASAA